MSPAPDFTPYSGLLPTQGDPATFPTRAQNLFKWFTQTGAPQLAALAEFLAEAVAESDTLLEAVHGLQTGVGGALVPVGAIMPFVSASVPDGWLAMDGRAVTPDMADLRQLLLDDGAIWGTDANGDPLLADLRGEFVRGWDQDRGVDAGRAFGSAQGDEIRAHSHQVKEGSAAGGGTTDEWLTSGDDYASVVNSYSTTTETGGAETRPRNVALIYAIKAYHALETATGRTLEIEELRDLAPVAFSGRFADLAGVPASVGSGGFVSPVDFGAPTDGVSPASAAIQAAIQAVAVRDRIGVVWLDREYALDQPLVLPRGVTLQGNANFNRRSFPNTFNGGRLYPHASAPEGMALVEVGTAGNMDANPNGSFMEGVALDGRLGNGDHLRGAIGLHIRDTSDFRSFNCYFGGFDRTDNTGFCALVEGSGEGNCFGTTFSQCVFSNSQHGVFYTGLGTTDMRHSDNLYVGVTRALTLGYDDRGSSVVQQGGAGCQVVNDHFTYTGMPGPGWFIRTGGQGGSLMCSNVYFDQHGTSCPVRLGNAKAKITNCHFLCATAQNAEGLIRVQTGGSQQTVVVHNTLDLVGCDLQALVLYSAITGTPTGGVVAQNEVYGAGPGWKGIAQDGAGTVLAPTDDGAFFLGQNVRCI